MTDKFLFAYAVAKRAKEIVEEGIHYQGDTRDRRPILEAIEDIRTGLLKVEISETKTHDIKEEEDTLDLLYDNVKLPEHEIETKAALIEEVKRKPKDFLEEEDELEEELAVIDKVTALDVEEEADVLADDEEEEDEEEDIEGFPAEEPEFVVGIEDDVEPVDDVLKE